MQGKVVNTVCISFNFVVIIIVADFVEKFNLIVNILNIIWICNEFQGQCPETKYKRGATLF